jgi:hypothetical protein
MSQFVTLEQAQAVAAQLTNIGGGVLPYNPNTVMEINPPGQDNDPKRSGIYIPVYLTGPFATPQNGDQKFYFLRFANGAEGFNAGLILGEMTLFPTRWPLMLALEVNAAAQEANNY